MVQSTTTKEEIKKEQHRDCGLFLITDVTSQSRNSFIRDSGSSGDRQAQDFVHKKQTTHNKVKTN